MISGGDALADTSAGVFARLAAEVALGGLAPASLLALLKHPLLRLGAQPAPTSRGRGARESGAAGPRPRPGSVGLAQALGGFRAELMKLRRKEASDLHPSDPRTHLSERRSISPPVLVSRLTEALAPLEGLRHATFAAIAARHRTSSPRWARTIREPARACRPRRRDARRGVRGNCAASRRRRFRVEPGEYGLFRAAISDRAVRRPGAPGLRLRIYGLLEARLQSVDRVVLGGLIEGVWPPETAPTPGSAVPCGMRWASTCRSGASRSPRTTSRRRSARTR